MLTPDVPWIADGLRWKNEDWERKVLHDKLLKMYQENGFEDKLIVIEGNDYTLRLERVMELVDKLLE